MDYKETKLKLRSDWPVSTSATLNGANLNGLAFNVDYIARRDPMLVLELQRFYQRARALLDQDPLNDNDEQFEKAYSFVIGVDKA